MFTNMKKKEPIVSQFFGMALCAYFKKQNRTAINIGCHNPRFIDAYSNIFCTVITIDPFISFNLHLKDRIQNKTDAEIIMHGVALSEKSDDHKTYYMCLDNIGISTTLYENYQNMKKLFPDASWSEVNVPICNLDDMYPTIDNVDLFKVDAENEDVDILMGAKNLIKRNLPVIQIEHDDDNKGYEMLTHLGYKKIEPPFDTTNSYYVYESDLK